MNLPYLKSYHKHVMQHLAVAERTLEIDKQNHAPQHQIAKGEAWVATLQREVDDQEKKKNL